MKVNNIFFTTLFITLAAAGLGFAVPALPANTTSLTSSSITVDSLDAVIQSGGLGNLSDKCKNALIKMVTSKEFLTCIPLTALAPLLPIALDPTIIPKVIADPAKNYKPLMEQPLVQFADGICKAPKCADKDVKGAIGIIKDGCKDELTAQNDFIVLLYEIAVFYSPARDSICFKDGKTFCFDETILGIISLPKSNFPVTKNPLLDSIIVADCTQICSKCNKNIVNTIFNFIDQNSKDPDVQAVLAALKLDDKAYSGAKLGVAVKCGQNFEDGKITP